MLTVLSVSFLVMRYSDSPSASPLDGFDFQTMRVTPRTTLLKAVQAIQAAAGDERIKGIYLNFDENVNISIASKPSAKS